MSALFSANKAQAQRRQTVTLSVKNYNNDKLHFNDDKLHFNDDKLQVAIRPKRKKGMGRSAETEQPGEPIGAQLQTQPIDIDMHFKPYRSAGSSSRRSSITSADDAFGGDPFGSEDSSDNESGRHPQVYDAQRTSAFS